MHRGVVADGLQAELLADPAGFGADAAMLVRARVMLAHLGASAARRNARQELRFDHALVGFDQARQDSAGGEADVGAIEIEADASGEIEIGFRQTGIGATATDGRTFEAGIDGSAGGIDGAARMGMRVQHFVDVMAHASSAPNASLMFPSGVNASGADRFAGFAWN